MYFLMIIMACCPFGLALMIAGAVVRLRKSDESKKIGGIQILIGLGLFLGSIIGWMIFKTLR